MKRSDLADALRLMRLRTRGLSAHPAQPWIRTSLYITRSYSRFLLLLGLTGFVLFTGAPVHAAEGIKTPVVAAKGWRFQVLHANLTGVDNLVQAADGTLYASRELAQGQGLVVRLRDGRVETLISNLNRPDGLHLQGRWLYVTEEVADGRVLEYDLCSGKQRELVTLHNPEGIVMLPDGDLAVNEDSVNGRLVRVLRNGVVEVITSGLNRPEGLAVTDDGTLIIAETGTGRVLARAANGEMSVLVEDLEEPDQVEVGPDGAIWITEDLQPGRLLRYQNGTLEVILTGLWAPQGMIITGPNSLLLAEQGRGRILQVTGAEP
jgi:sugar lactone lactonase YvrE